MADSGGTWRGPAPTGTIRPEIAVKPSTDLKAGLKETPKDGQQKVLDLSKQEETAKDSTAVSTIAAVTATTTSTQSATALISSTPTLSSSPDVENGTAKSDIQRGSDKPVNGNSDESVKVKPEVKVEIKPEEPDFTAGDGGRITIDTYNSDLHLETEADRLTCGVTRGPGFEYMWAGARATNGVSKGKVCFEAHILEEQHVVLPAEETNPYVVRVGWSVDGSDYQLGETKLSWGYGGTAKISCEGKFRDYGRPFGTGDVITCYIDLDATPKAIFFMCNGQYLGVAFRMTNELDGKAVYPHVTLKNMRCRMNFGEDPPKFPVTLGFTMMQRLPADALAKPLPGPLKREEAEIIMMVGLPACGKSYWADKFCIENPGKKYYILGTNAIMDKMRVTGLIRKRNYHGRWDELIDRATKVLNKLFEGAEYRVKNYILDQTNVYLTARRRKMDSFRGYKRIAAVIVNEPTVLAKRTEMQQKLEGKMVPVEAVMEMQRNFTLPEVGPSFDEVRFIEEKPPNAQVLVEQYRVEGEEFKRTGLKRPVAGTDSPSDPKKSKGGEDHVSPAVGVSPSTGGLRAPTPSPRGPGSSSRFSSPRPSSTDSRGSPSLRGTAPMSSPGPRGLTPGGIGAGARAPAPSSMGPRASAGPVPLMSISQSHLRPDSQTSKQDGEVGSTANRSNIDQQQVAAGVETASPSSDASRIKSQGILGAAPEGAGRGLLGAAPGAAVSSMGTSSAGKVVVSSAGSSVPADSVKSDFKGPPTKTDQEPKVDDHPGKSDAKDKTEARDRSYDRSRSEQKGRAGDKVPDERGRSGDRSKRDDDRGGRSDDRHSDSRSGRSDDRRGEDRSRVHERGKHEERSRASERPRMDERSRTNTRERDDRGRMPGRSRSRERGKFDDRRDVADRGEDRFGRDRSSWVRSREFASGRDRAEDGRTQDFSRPPHGAARDMDDGYGDYKPLGVEVRRVDQGRESWYRNDAAAEPRMKPDHMSEQMGVSADVDRFSSRKPSRWGPEQPLTAKLATPGVIGAVDSRSTPDGRFQLGRRDDSLGALGDQGGIGYGGDHTSRYGDSREPVRYPDTLRPGPYRQPDVPVKEEMQEGVVGRGYGVGYGRNSTYPSAGSSALPMKEEHPWKVEKNFGRGDYPDQSKAEPYRDASLYAPQDRRGGFEPSQYNEGRVYRASGDASEQRGYPGSDSGGRDPRYGSRVESSYGSASSRETMALPSRESAHTPRDQYDQRRQSDYVDRGYEPSRLEGDRAYERYRVEPADDRVGPVKSSYESYGVSANRPSAQMPFPRSVPAAADEKRASVSGQSFASERYEPSTRSQIPDYSGYGRDLTDRQGSYGSSTLRESVVKPPSESYGVDHVLRSYQQPKTGTDESAVASKVYGDHGSRQDYRTPVGSNTSGTDAYNYYGAQQSAYGVSRPAVNPAGSVGTKPLASYTDYSSQPAPQAAATGSYASRGGLDSHAKPYGSGATAYSQQGSVGSGSSVYGQQSSAGSSTTIYGQQGNAGSSASVYGLQSGASSQQSSAYLGSTPATTAYTAGYAASVPAYGRAQSDSHYSTPAVAQASSVKPASNPYEPSTYGQYGGHQGYSSYATSTYGSASALSSSTAVAPAPSATSIPTQPAAAAASAPQVASAATASVAPAAALSQPVADAVKTYEQQQQDYQKAYSQWYANYARAFAQLQAQQQPQ